MITLSLSYDPQTKMERFTHGFAPVMRLSSNPSVANYESHLEALERAVAGDLDCIVIVRLEAIKITCHCTLKSL